ncbi:MAG: exbB [Chlamydiia bacterium]|nr:exbB [Chlamydiia bacterium]
MDTSTFSSILQLFSEWIANWNLVLVVIFLCSVIGAAVFLERLLYLRKTEIDTDFFIIQLREAIVNGNIVEAMSTCENTKGAVANIVKAGLCKHERPREQIESAMELRGLIEVSKMEKNARILSIIAHITPLIGLLGTVLGFIKAFAEMRQSHLVEISANQIGEAMEYALVTTAAGLVIAIPAVIGYNYIISRIEGMIVDIQATASEVVDLLVCRQEKF